MLHVLWDCVVASDVWAGSLTRLQKSGSGQVSFFNLMEEMMLKVTNKEMELFLDRKSVV